MSKVYLIPAPLDTETLDVIPPYVFDAIKECELFFVEDQRTTRRYFKSGWKEMVIDNYTWHTLGEPGTHEAFLKALSGNKVIGIVSEAGCPGVADPGQELIALAHQQGATVKPLVGPSSILLALMASGFNGQRFQFVGYLPIEETDRIKAIRLLESTAAKERCTQLFIETPYRNNQLLVSLLKHLQDQTLLCVATDLTSKTESIQTRTVAQWRKEMPSLHKRPTLFALFVA
jgi:16S rRNA (cytidine1402-2'-O)-methyltransferase